MIEAVYKGQFDVGIPDRKNKSTSPTLCAVRAVLLAAYQRKTLHGCLMLQDQPQAARQCPGGHHQLLHNGALSARRQRKESRIKLYKTFSLSVPALKADDVDKVLTDGMLSRGYVKALPDTYKVVCKPMRRKQFVSTYKKGSDLVKPINAALKSDGTLKRFDQKWFVNY